MRITTLCLYFILCIISSCTIPSSYGTSEIEKAIEERINELHIASKSYCIVSFDENNKQILMQVEKKSNEEIPSQILRLYTKPMLESSSLKNDSAFLKYTFFDNAQFLSSESFLKQLSGICSFLPCLCNYVSDSQFTNNYPAASFINKKIVWGWKTFIFDNNCILWSIRDYKDKTILVLNILDKQLFVGVIYSNTKQLYRENDNLLSNPIATAILKEIYSTEKKYRVLFQSRDQVAFSQYNNTSDDSLKHLKTSSCQYAIPMETPVANIDEIRNNEKRQVYFEITKDTTVNLLSSGQTVNEIWGSNKLWGRDFIEIKLAIDNRTRFRSKFFYKHPYINAEKTKQTDVAISYYDIDDYTYNLEVAIPWKYIIKENESLMSFTYQLKLNDSDKDPKETESVLSNSETDDFYRLSSLNNIAQPIIIDGKEDIIWKKAASEKFDVPLSGSVDNELDNSGTYKTLWDRENVYFLFTITDQAKHYAWYITKDFCRITSAKTGQLVWQESGCQSNIFPFYYNNSTFRLSKGNYILEYISDSELAFDNWCSLQLPTNFYGAYLFYSKSQK
ncbi:hypothetical protein JW887_07115 [Candidatus Dojkabacteria bacterium]|nr:hypothetical protein [Candidatus Dojkabacteria bacterium]